MRIWFLLGITIILATQSVKAIQSEQGSIIRDQYERDQKQRKKLSERRNVLYDQEARLRGRLLVAKSSKRPAKQGECDVCVEQAKKCKIDLEPKSELCLRVFQKSDCDLKKMNLKQQKQIFSCWSVQNYMAIESLTKQLQKVEEEIRGISETLGDQSEAVSDEENKVITLPPPQGEETVTTPESLGRPVR